MRPAFLLPALVLLVAGLAGCAEKGGGDAADAGGGGTGPVAGDMLYGWVLDASVTPIVGATLSIQSEGLEVETARDGGYGFSLVPIDTVLVVVVQAKGFQPSSKSLSIAPDTVVELNFTLDRVPVQQPYFDQLSFQGHLGCDVTVRYGETIYDPSCSSAWPNHEDVWEFTVDPKLAGVVIEAIWDDGGNPMAAEMRLVVETVHFGDFDEVLSDQIGQSPLRVQIPQVQAQRFYAGQGGTIRVTASIDQDVDANEAGAGAALAIEQTFEVFAFPFYIAPPPPDFSIQS